MTADITATSIARWDSLFASRSWGKYPPEELVRFVARTYPDLAGRKALRTLEVGCGPGANLWYLAREGFTVAGIDASSHAIASAMERLGTEGLIDPARPPDLRIGNFATLPWEDKSFDMVIDIEAIYANTIIVIRSAIDEILRVLKPGGYFFGKMFGPKTTGITSGKMLDDYTIENPDTGPLAGMGVVHAFTDEGIKHEFKSFSDLKLDWVRRSDRGGTYEIFEWLIQARK